MSIPLLPEEGLGEEGVLIEHSPPALPSERGGTNQLTH